MANFHQVALTFVPGIGPITARALIEHFTDADSIFQAGKRELSAVEGMKSKTINAILEKKGFDLAEKEMVFMEQLNVSSYFYTDENYPARLRHCYDAPSLLYFKGAAELNKKKVISVVGTRNATAYGKELCNELVSGLRSQDILVVSGLAYGIDIMAHKACLKEEIPTIAALGHGLDRIYPAVHTGIAEKMIAKGGLISEFPSGTIPDRENFPRRNRIIAGMADATIVVEASFKGGALITAEIANSYNRDVFAFPGRTDDEFSVGCNYLIKTNRAHMISNINDLEYILGWTKNLKKEAKQISLQLNLSADEKKVTDLLEKKDLVPIDDLLLSTGIPQSKLAMTILGLEMQGIIVALPGKMYKLA